MQPPGDNDLMISYVSDEIASDASCHLVVNQVNSIPYHQINFNAFFLSSHDDIIKWKHSQRYGPFVRGIHRSPVNSPHKGQWRRTLLFSLICAWINSWVNNGEAGDLRRHSAHYDVIVMILGLMIRPVLTRCGRDKMATCSNAFSWMKMFEFPLI